MSKTPRVGWAAQEKLSGRVKPDGQLGLSGLGAAVFSGDDGTACLTLGDGLLNSHLNCNATAVLTT